MKFRLNKGSIFFFLLFFFVCFALQAGGKEVDSLFGLPASRKDLQEQILHRKGYTVSYNKETMQPNWVAWHLTAEKTEGTNARPSSNAFHEDTDVPSPRATLGDERDCNQSKGRGKPAGLEIKILVKQTQKCSDFFFFN